MGFELRNFAVNNGLFLRVEHSVTGRAWRDRLDARGSARALAIVQRHALPELLARVLAGRGVEADAVEFSRSDHAALDARSGRAHRHAGRGGAACGGDGARRDHRHLRRLRCGRSDLGGIAGALFALRRPRSADPYSRPPVRRLRPECRGDPWTRGARRHASGHRRLRHHQHRAVGGRRAPGSTSSSSTTTRPRRRCRRRSPSSTPTGSTTLPARPPCRGRRHLPAGGGGEPGAAARWFWPRPGPRPICWPSSTMWRSARCPTWCR